MSQDQNTQASDKVDESKQDRRITPAQWLGYTVIAALCIWAGEYLWFPGVLLQMAAAGGWCGVTIFFFVQQPLD